MAHYAFLNDNNIVVEVIVGRDEDDLIDGVESWEQYYGELRGLRCLQTSYNTKSGTHLNDGIPFRGNYAGPGYEYREDLDAFIPPKPHASWILNEDTFTWEPPIPKPSGEKHVWDEQAGAWVEV